MRALTSAAALSVALALTGCASVGNRTASDQARVTLCTQLDYPDLIATPPPPGTLRVPAVVHLMDSYETRPAKSPAPAKSPVKDAWTNPDDDYVRKFFGAAGEFSVTQVWKAAGIRLDVERVEHCFYPDTFLVSVDGELVLRVPDPSAMRKEQPAEQQQRIDQYLEINQFYGRPGKLNIYIWDKLSERARGYGESPRRHRSEVEDGRLQALATAWYRGGDLRCRTPNQSLVCRRILAHEIGHALGLKHICRACDIARQEPSSCTPICWTAPNYYVYQGEQGASAVCFPGTPETSGRCCSGCEPGDPVSDGINACGQPIVCCPESPNDPLVTTLMYVDATKSRSIGDLCEGEVHSVRSAIREFFPK